MRLCGGVSALELVGFTRQRIVQASEACAVMIVQLAYVPAFGGESVGARAYSTSLTRPAKGVRSLPGMLSAVRSKASTKLGNCRLAARPVPSMPGKYSSIGRLADCVAVLRPGTYGLTKRGGAPASW